ncbi:MAG: glycosyltransferase family 2 protein [Alphaproteobacteria bacterium]
MPTGASGAAPRLSVVTLSFNQAPFLRRALDSVLAQDWPDVEYIVVDPGSSDGSRDILAGYAGRLAATILEPDAGPGDGLNKGFARATGKVLAYLNADDAYLPGAFREAMAAFAAPDRPDVVCGHGLIVDGQGRVVRRLRSAPFGLRRFAYGASVQMQQSTFFRADAFRRTPGFNNDNRTCWDAEILMELAKAGARFRIVDRYWSLFRIYEGSITGSGHLNARYAEDLARMFQAVMGRPRAPLDGLVGRALRLARWATDPVGLAVRLQDKLAGPPACVQDLAAKAA